MRIILIISLFTGLVIAGYSHFKGDKNIISNQINAIDKVKQKTSGMKDFANTHQKPEDTQTQNPFESETTKAIDENVNSHTFNQKNVSPKTNILVNKNINTNDQNQDSLQNPDEYAVGLVEAEREISIGKYIPVSILDDSLTEVSETDKIEIGEYIPFDDETILVAEQEYIHQQSLGLNKLSNEGDGILPLIPNDVFSVNDSKIIDVGEFLPINESF